MIPLQTIIKVRDREFKCLKRSKDIALYEVSPIAAPSYFEVIKVQFQEAHTKRGISYDAKELYPSTSKWGKFGFTFKVYAEALLKFNYLLSRTKRY